MLLQLALILDCSLNFMVLQGEKTAKPWMNILNPVENDDFPSELNLH